MSVDRRHPSDETMRVDTILAWLDPVLPLHDEALPERLREPLVRLRDNHRGAVELLRDVATAGVSYEDPRIDYLEVQIDRATWDELSAYGGQS